jgi:hypothetical protein
MYQAHRDTQKKQSCDLGLESNLFVNGRKLVVEF